ncbi:MAG: TM2 domain-containing protein [Pseudomonadales bacterium]
MQKIDPDFSAEIVADLYRYRHKRSTVAILLAVLGGIFGAHRFYLGKTLTGVLMLLTGGGGLCWWIRDMFRIRAMVEAFNSEEDTRADAQLPPQGLGFLPPRAELNLGAPPTWANKRRGRLQVFGSAVVLILIGLSMGAISGATGIYEPVVIILVFIVVTLTAARWQGISRVPILSGLSRWNHRLRLYYHTVDPGSIWLLALRPFAGLFFAPWRSRARAEVRLYLQLGVVFSLPFALLDTLEVSESDSLAAGLGPMVAEFFQTLFYTYAFVAPIGALLTTQLLLSRRDRMLWALSAATVVSIFLGLVAVGAV